MNFISAINVVIIIFVSVIACHKPNPMPDNLSMDEAVADHLTLSIFPQELAERICFISPIIVYIGNGENIFSDLLPNSIPSSPSLNQNMELKNVIDFQVTQLRQALAETDCSQLIKDGIGKGKQPPRAMLLAIKDGPGKADSAIEVTRYAWVNDAWSVVDQDSTHSKFGLAYKSWSIDKDNVLSTNPDDISFEIHLPSQIEAIVKFISSHYRDDNYDQYTYLMKSHGSKLINSVYDYDLFDYMTANIPEDSQVLRTFMFDPNGPVETKLYSSDMYHPFWIPHQGCVALSQDSRITAELLANDRGLCTCVKPLKELALPLNNFAACESPSSEDIFGSEFGFLSPGKGLFMLSYPEPNREIGSPSGVSRVASAIAYNMDVSESINGVFKPSLPTAENQTLVLLDACYGDETVANLFERQSGESVKVIFSPNPVSMNITDYGSLNMNEYIALGFNTNANDSEDLRVSFYRHSLGLDMIKLSQRGLIDLKWVAKRQRELVGDVDGMNPVDLSLLKKQSMNSDENSNRFRYFSTSLVRKP